MTRRDEILSQVSAVEALPLAAMRVIEMLQSPDTDLVEIGRTISHDPGMTANVLRMANSALFGGRSTITTVDAAIARLGTRRVLGLVVSSAIGPSVQRQIQGYDLSPGALWRHGVAVAIGTQVLPDLLKVPSTDYAFTAGLLVDVGKSVLGHFLEVDGGAIANIAFESKMPFEQAEQQVLGIDHTEVGAALLEHWKLPEAIVQVVRWHHDPVQCSEIYRPVADIVHASDQICTLAGLGTGMDGSQYVPCEDALASMNLSEKVIEATLCRVVEKLLEVDDIFEQETVRN